MITKTSINTITNDAVAEANVKNVKVTTLAENKNSTMSLSDQVTESQIALINNTEGI